MSPPSSETVPADLAMRRRVRNRSAARHSDVSFFSDEIGGRMFERLDYIKLEPRAILDLHCGLGSSSKALAKRFPDALVVPLDPAIGLLRTQAGPKKRFKWFAKSSARVCGEATALPIAAKSIDLVWSNLFALSSMRLPSSAN